VVEDGAEVAIVKEESVQVQAEEEEDETAESERTISQKVVEVPTTATTIPVVHRRKEQKVITVTCVSNLPKQGHASVEIHVDSFMSNQPQ
jgi:hypothetical protein